MPHRILRCVVLTLATCGLCTSTLYAQPAVTHTVPAAVRPGATTDLVLHGSNLTDGTQLWTSFSGTVELLPVDPKAGGKQLACRITLPADAGVGVGGLVAGNASGVSELVPLAIDDLPSVAEAGGNNSFEKAQPLDLPGAVDGTASGVQSDFYKFHATKDQRLSVEVLARRIQSTMDPVVRLLDGAGRELQISDDDAALGADSRLQHVFQAEGDYVLEVRDNRYQAGGRYRLRIGDFPLVNTPYPLGVTRGQKQELRFTGPAADDVAPLPFEAPEHTPGERRPLAARYADGNASALATLVSSELAELTETEPNNAVDQATPVQLPAALNGRLAEPGDKDYFAFQGSKGIRYRFQALSRSLGSPTLALLQLYKEDGTKVAESSIGAQDELFLDYAFPDDGKYRLFVEDLLHRGGSGHAYRIEATPKYFGLQLKNDKGVSTGFVMPVTHGAFPITLTCERLGYDGPIELKLAEGTQGLEILNPTIPQGAKEYQVYIRVAADAAEGTLNVLRLYGEAQVGELAVRETVQTEAVLRAKLPQVAFPPGWRNGLLRVALAAKRDPFFGMNPADAKLLVARSTGQGTLTLTLNRIDKEFKDPVVLIPDSTPGEAKVAVKQDKDNYTLTLTAATSAGAEDRVRLLGYASYKGQGTLLPIEVPIEVIDPLQVELQVAGPLTAGQKQKATIRIQRQGGDAQPVTVKFTKLPAGVTAPDVTIPADQSEAVAELSAAADAAPGKFPDLTVQAATKFQGQDITVDKGGVEVETQPAS